MEVKDTNFLKFIRKETPGKAHLLLTWEYTLRIATQVIFIVETWKGERAYLNTDLYELPLLK